MNIRTKLLITFGVVVAVPLFLISLVFFGFMSMQPAEVATPQIREFLGEMLVSVTHNWGKQSNEETARYMEYKNTGEGANASERVAWSKQLTKKEAEAVTVDALFRTQSNWNPID